MNVLQSFTRKQLTTMMQQNVDCKSRHIHVICDPASGIFICFPLSTTASELRNYNAKTATLLLVIYLFFIKNKLWVIFPIILNLLFLSIKAAKSAIFLKLKYIFIKEKEWRVEIWYFLFSTIYFYLLLLSRL